jgi:hypothetical protein
VVAVFTFFYALIQINPAGIGLGSVQKVRIAGALHFDDKLPSGCVFTQNVDDALTGHGNLRILSGFEKFNVLNAGMNALKYVVQKLNQYVFMLLNAK